MKKLLMLAVLVALTVATLPYALTFSSGAPTGHTGAPGESNCSACHGGTVNGGPERVRIRVSADCTSYVPGQTYPVIVEFTESARSRHGFSLTTLNAANEPAGSVTVTQTDLTQSETSGERTYVTHTRSGTEQASWTFDWTAPPAGSGPVTFYAAANAADNNGSSSGDNIYTISTTLTESTVTTSRDAAALAVRLFPNPAVDRVTVDYHLDAPAPVVLELYDAAGRRVARRTWRRRAAGTQQLTWRWSEVPPAGVYTLRLELGSRSVVRRVAVC